MEKSFELKAVAIGSLVNVGGKHVGDILGHLVVTITLVARGMTVDQLKLVPHHAAYLVWYLICTFIFSALGGFAAAKIAQSRELLHAGATGLVRIALGPVMFAITQDEMPLWHSVLTYVSVLPAALLGGYLGRGKTC